MNITTLIRITTKFFAVRTFTVKQNLAGSQKNANYSWQASKGSF